MQKEEWARIIVSAYSYLGEDAHPPELETFFNELQKGTGSNEDKKTFQEAVVALTTMFYKMATTGQTFGSLDRIKNTFGFTLEDNFGLQTGPFIDMAKTYWTFKLEVEDLFPEHKNLLLWQILYKVESDVRSLFFPTPGPKYISVKRRIRTQRPILQYFAPEIDINRFISENPILRREAKHRLFSGKTILFVLIILIFIWLIYRFI